LEQFNETSGDSGIARFSSCCINFLIQVCSWAMFTSIFLDSSVLEFVVPSCAL
jgi:hypothetical protein